MLQKLILNKKNLQMQYLKKLFQMLLIIGIVLMLESVAFYMRDFELVIILLFLFIYFPDYQRITAGYCENWCVCQCKGEND